MPQSKTEKQLKALEKLEAEYKAELDRDSYLSYRATMLGSQIRNLKRKLNIPLVSPFEEK